MRATESGLKGEEMEEEKKQARSMATGEAATENSCFGKWICAKKENEMAMEDTCI